MEKTRIHYLDSARGIAALTVVIYHCLGGYETFHFSDFTQQVGSFVFNGKDAVSFFFVLSGFVLSYKYFLEDSIPNYPKYIISRVFRLYPAYWFVLIVFIIFMNSGFKGFSIYPVKIIREALLYLNFNPFLGQGWSLNIELVLSLLLPVFIIAAQREIKYLYYILPMTLIFHLFISHFLFHFILGIIASYWFIKANSPINSIYLWLKKHILWIFPVLWLTFSSRWLFILILPKEILASEGFSDYTGIDFSTISAISSFIILIILLKSKRLQAFLNKRIFQFLGKISYSLYICHWFFLYGVFGHYHQNWLEYFHLDDQSTIVLVSIATIISSILFSTFMYYYIEKPFIKWGRKLASRFD